MTRLNMERQNKLEPKRMRYCKDQLEKLGFEVTTSSTEIRFVFKGHPIKLFPYSGWASGKTIDDCRGINNLLKQVNK